MRSHAFAFSIFTPGLNAFGRLAFGAKITHDISKLLSMNTGKVYGASEFRLMHARP